MLRARPRPFGIGRTRSQQEVNREDGARWRGMGCRLWRARPRRDTLSGPGPEYSPDHSAVAPHDAALGRVVHRDVEFYPVAGDDADQAPATHFS